LRKLSLEKWQKLFAWVCVLALAVTTLPLYAIAFYNHPYYDDYGFSAPVHQAWKETGSLNAVFSAAIESAQKTRLTWQGTYTGTMLSNLQPSLFSESLYWIGNFILLTAFILCFWVLFSVLFRKLGLAKWARVSLCSLSITLMIQFMPDVGEAFYWFNGGIGNVFIYSLLALAIALLVKLCSCKGNGVGYILALAVLAVLLGGGSYGGGLFSLCLLAVLLAWLFAKKHAKRWHVLGIGLVFAVCFAYSISAPGNAVRAGVIKYESSAVKAVVQSLYYGAALMGGYVDLPLLAITLVLLPALFEAAKKSEYAFRHPWLVLMIGACLFCTQLTPPLYSIASIGAGRIVNTYFISFTVMWFLYVYYLCGHFARKISLPEMNVRRFGALVLAALCMLGAGSLAFKRSGDVLYGVQNLSGPSAALSIITGEASQYDWEMTQREQLLNDATQPVITLRTLTAVPAVFMDDLIMPNATYDVRPSLCLYYGKEAIRIEGEVDAQ